MNKLIKYLSAILLIVSTNIVAMQQTTRKSRTSARAAEQPMRLLTPADERYYFSNDAQAIPRRDSAPAALDISPVLGLEFVVQQEMRIMRIGEVDIMEIDSVTAPRSIKIHHENPQNKNQREDVLEVGADVPENQSRFVLAFEDIEEGQFASQDLSTQALFCAAFSGDVFLAKQLIDLRAQMNSSLSNGKTPLHIAAEQGNLAMVQYLVKSGSRCDALTQDGKTATKLAQENKYNEVVVFLNQVSRKKSLKNAAPSTSALAEAKVVPRKRVTKTRNAKRGREGASDVEQQLQERAAPSLNKQKKSSVAHKIQMDSHPQIFETNVLQKLAGAITSKNLGQVRNILNGEGKNLRPADLDTSFNGRPLIHLAEGDLAIMKELLDRGANIDGGTESGGVTALHAAVYWDNCEMVQYLLERGANPHIRRNDMGNESPYEIAQVRVAGQRAMVTEKRKEIAACFNRFVKKQNRK